MMQSITKHGLAIILVTTLFGCVNLSPEHAQPVATPIANTISGAHKKPVETLYLVAWQRFFADPNVKQLIRLALENNRDLHIAAANVAEARGLYQIQRQELIPTINANATTNRSQNSTNLTGNDNVSHNYAANVGLISYEVDFWGRISNLKQAALANYFATLEAQRASQLSVISETANAYYNWLAATENLRLANETLKARNQSLKLIQLRESVGIASALDLAQAEISKATVEAQKAQNERTLSGLQAVLELLVGTPIDQLIASQNHGGKPIFDFSVPAQLSSTVLLSRPDIIAAEEALRAANANISAARAAFLPKLTLVGNGGFASNDLNNLFEAGSRTWTFTPSISLPLFGNANQANLDVAIARQTKSIAEYEKAIQVAFSEVYTQFQARKARQAEITANEKLVKAQKKRLTLAEARYNAGLASYIEVLDSQQDSFAAEQSLLESERGEVEALIQLYKALGGGDDVNMTFRQQLTGQASRAGT